MAKLSDVKDVIWFTSMSCVALVKVDFGHGDGIEYFIGAVRGQDEDEDKLQVASWGARFPKEIGDIMFPKGL